MDNRPPQTLCIRPALDADAAAIAQLLEQFGYPTSTEQCLNRLRRMNADTFHTLVAIETSSDRCEELAGFIGLLRLQVYTECADIGWVLALAVGQRHRRKGIGTALLNSAESYFRRHGIEQMHLHSAKDNLAAHLFYQANGFSDVALRFQKRIGASS